MMVLVNRIDSDYFKRRREAVEMMALIDDVFTTVLTFVKNILFLLDLDGGGFFFYYWFLH